MIRIFAAVFLLLGLAGAAIAQAAYQIRPGDVLQIEVLEDSELNRRTLVLPDGTITFPFVGSVPAAGRTTQQVSAALSQGLAGNFAVTPNVFVSVGALGDRRAANGGAVARRINVYVIGEVSSPGRREVAQGTTILQFLAEAGGLTRFAAERRIQLRRNAPGGEQVYSFDYRGMGAAGGIAPNTTLADGDVIVVPERRLFE